MIESPVLQELIAEVEARTRQASVIEFLEARFAKVPDSILASIKSVTDEQRLADLTKAEATCASLSEFAHRLPQ